MLGRRRKGIVAFALSALPKASPDGERVRRDRWEEIVRKLLATGAVTALAAMLSGGLPSPAVAASEGSVQGVVFGGAAYGKYLEAPSEANKAWMRNHLWRMVTWSPYFDSRLSWYPNAWAYSGSDTIYPGSSVAREHPEWIFKDPTGKPLYVPFACSGGTCPEYAGNIANAAYRKWWIETAKAMMAKGYIGLYIDDVDMEFRVSNGWGEQVPPIDPATNKPMTYEAWRAYMAEFMEQIRSTLPGVEIIHNVIWFSDYPTRLADPYIRREIKAASGVFLERGANDPGFSGGSGQWSLRSFLSYAEEVNALGSYIVMGIEATNVQGELYDLAAYFLVNDGKDAIQVGEPVPQQEWSGWETQLGPATDKRYEWHGLLRRDFTGGRVLLDPPGEAAQTVTLASPMRDREGHLVTSVRLTPASAAVLTNIKVRPGAEAAPSSPPAVNETQHETATGEDVATEYSDPGSGVITQVLAAARAVTSQAVEGVTGHHRATPATTRRGVTRTLLTRVAYLSGHRLGVYGRVVGASRGTVVVDVEMRRGRRWQLAVHIATTLDGGARFAVSIALATAGASTRVHAVYLGGARSLGSRSAAMTPAEA